MEEDKKQHALVGRKQSPEHIRKRTEAMRRAFEAMSPERNALWRENNSRAHKGRVAHNKGKKYPELSGPNSPRYGKKMPAEVVERHRQKITGTKQSPEWVANRMAGRSGYRHSEETKTKIRRTNIRTW